MADENFEDIIDEESYSLYSWTIKPPNIAIKTLDKSSIINGGTGIPAKFRSFFGIEKFSYGDKKPVELLYENNRYKAFFNGTKKNTTTLQYYSDFMSVIRNKFPNITKHIQEKGDKLDYYPEMEITKRLENNELEIRFIGDDKVIKTSLFSSEEFSILFSDLKRLIHQSQTNVLTTKSYIETFGRFQVTKSFGQGTPAKVTWLSLTDPTETQKIVKEFFVSFYYDKSEKLFLTLGIKEDIKEQYDWPEDIQDKYPRFIDNPVSGSISTRYPKSRIFSEYHIDLNKIDESLDSQKEEIESNLSTALLLYVRTLKSMNPLQPSSKINYWRVAPGRNGVLWKIWRDEKFCSIGYHQYEPYLEELLQISDKNTFNAKLIDIAQKNNVTEDFSFMLSSQPASHQNTIWSFFHEMKIGDIVIASTGRSRIYGVGTILSDISSRNSEDYSQIREVRWDYLDLDVSIPPEVTGNFNVTLNKLSSEDYSKIIGLIDSKKKEPEPVDEMESDPILSLLKRKGQIILYGPPGTGKTYHIQAIKRNLDSSHFTIKANDYAEIQFFWVQISKKSQFDYSHINLKEIYTYNWNPDYNWNRYFLAMKPGDIIACYGWDEHRIIGFAKCLDKTETTFKYQFIFVSNGPSYKTLRDDPKFCQSKIIRTKANAVITTLETSDFERIITLAGTSTSDLNLPSSTSDQNISRSEFITFHQSFSYEEFIEGLRPFTDEEGKISYNVQEGIFKRFCRSAFNVLLYSAGLSFRWDENCDVPTLTEDEQKLLCKHANKVPFYLFIDEINRGDISRIFGELITLLEKDKRICESLEITTRLPYSRTLFGIPPNLYIIGTMNTADKSIALIDIALRRRFGFKEMMPDYDLLTHTMVSSEDSIQEVFTVAISLLRTINKRILDEHDREHQIGHSYLIKLKDMPNRERAINELALIWYHEIIPLLHEYFYDSPKRLYKVIGSEFMISDPKSITFTAVKEGEVFLSACTTIIKDMD